MDAKEVGVKARLIQEDGGKTYAVIFDSGDEVFEGLTEFAREQGLTAAHFTGVGAFSDVVLGFFDLDKKDYEQIPIEEQVEVLSLVGDIALDPEEGGGPKVHAHVVVGKRDGTAYGGHLLGGHVRPTLEVIVEEAPGHLRRKPDPTTGLTLIDLP